MQFETLRRGSTGPVTGYLQDVLKRLGFYDSGITYIFGEKTENAVKKFQKMKGLEADGIVGKKTWDILTPYFTGNYSITVERGDTLFNIAKRTGTDLDLLIAANELSNPDILYPGQILTVPFMPFVIPTNIKYSSDVMNVGLESFRQRYPFIEISTVGQSEIGQPITLIRIGKGSRKIMYNASHHANEWITSLLMMKFTENFCYAYAKNEALGSYSPKEIFDTATLYIIPMVNPDGVDLVTGQIKSDSKLYKKAEQMNTMGLPFPEGWKANIDGTDLNLNYPAEWERAREIKYAQGFTSPAPRDFVGLFPLSATESRTLAQLTKNIAPDLTLAYHSQGEIIYWKFSDYEPKGSKKIGEKFSELSGYSLELTPEDSAYAGYKDWYIQTFDRPGYTIEVGTGSSPVPLEQFPKIYKDNAGILMSAPLLL